MLHVDNITKRFGETVAVDSVSLTLEAGEIVCLLGPSGCGKTTLLRVIAGLETCESGTVVLHNRNITNVPPHQRGFGMMFQSFALFPHLNVAENIGYSLKVAGLDSAEITTRVHEMLSLVDLAGTENRPVDHLSGGQQQRVALARSLANRPELLMLDEPLGSLDRALRERLMVDLRRILKQIGMTALYVTHDQSEAFAIADRIAVMNNGKIVQLDTPQAVFARPASAFVARFMGFANVVTGRPTGDSQVEVDFGASRAGRGGRFTVANPFTLQKTVDLLIRPNALSTHATGNQISATLTDKSFRGRFTELYFAVEKSMLEFEVAEGNGWEIGRRYILNLDPNDLLVLGT